MSALDRVLEDLIVGRWVLTLEDTADGGTEVVAYRPPGWTGPDPHERIAAPDHDQMRAALARRHHTGDAVIDPDEQPQQDTDTTPGGGMEKEYPSLGGASGTHPDDR